MPPSNPFDRPFVKTSLCSFWKEGRCCKHSKDCNYAHGEAELRSVPPKPCLLMLKSGVCPYGNACHFADSHQSIRTLDASKRATVLNGLNEASHPKQPLERQLLYWVDRSVPTNGPNSKLGKPLQQHTPPSKDRCVGCCQTMVDGTASHVHVLIPCGHAVLCGECAADTQECPCCQSTVLFQTPILH